MGKTKILLAVLGGAAIAAGVAYLFATESGSQLRNKISDAAEDLSNKIMRKASTLAEDAMENAREEVKERVKSNM